MKRCSKSQPPSPKRIDMGKMGPSSLLDVALCLLICLTFTPAALALLHVSQWQHQVSSVHPTLANEHKRQRFLPMKSGISRLWKRDTSILNRPQFQLFSYSSNNNEDEDGMRGQEQAEWSFPRQNPWDRSRSRSSDNPFPPTQQDEQQQQEQQPPLSQTSSQLPYAPPPGLSYSVPPRQQQDDVLINPIQQKQEVPQVITSTPRDLSAGTETPEPDSPDRALAVISELKANAALFGAFAYGGLSLPSALTVTESKVTSVTSSLSTTRPIPANILLEAFVVLDIATLCLMIGCVAAAQWLIYRLTDGSWYMSPYPENTSVGEAEFMDSTTRPLGDQRMTLADEDTHVFDVVEIEGGPPAPIDRSTAMAEWRAESSAMGRLVTSPEYSNLFFIARTTFDLGLITLLLAVAVRTISMFDSTISAPVVVLLGATSLLLSIAFVKMQWTVFAPLERQQQRLQKKMRNKDDGIEPIMASLLSQIGTWIPFGVIAAAVVLATGSSYVLKSDGTTAISTSVPVSAEKLLEQVNDKLDAYSKEAGEAKLKTVLDKVNEEKDRKPSVKQEKDKTEKRDNTKNDRTSAAPLSSTKAETTTKTTSATNTETNTVSTANSAPVASSAAQQDKRTTTPDPTPPSPPPMASTAAPTTSPPSPPSEASLVTSADNNEKVLTTASPPSTASLGDMGATTLPSLSPPSPRAAATPTIESTTVPSPSLPLDATTSSSSSIPGVGGGSETLPTTSSATDTTAAATTMAP